MSGRARDVVAIGGSAGGYQLVLALLRALPADFGAAVAVVLHRSPSAPSRLSQLLARHAKLPLIEPRGGERFAAGHVFVAPPDLHMTVRGGRVQLDRGPKQHHTRPAVDPLFESLAEEYGPRVIGVLLSGALSDGVRGFVRIKTRGGLCLVQDPHEADFPSMPRNALLFDHVDMTFRIDGLATVLSRLVRGEKTSAVSQVEGVEIRRSPAGA